MSRCCYGAPRVQASCSTRAPCVGQPRATRTAIFEWIEAWYNPRRRHTALAMLSPVDCEHHWQRQATAAIKLHDLRHFDASGLIAAGCDVVTVQRSLGHAKATTTLNTYADLWPTAEDRTRKAAESLISASLGQPASSLAESAANTGA